MNVNNDLYQKIYKILAKLLPKQWDEVVCYFEYKPASYYFDFYIKDKKKYIPSYTLFNSRTLGKPFEQIYDLLSDTAQEDITTVLTLHIYPNGKIEYLYNHPKLKNGNNLYRKKWEAKYLVS